MNKTYIFPGKHGTHAYEILLVQRHEAFNLILGTLPVLHTKRIEGQGLDTQTSAVQRNVFSRLGPLAVPLCPGQPLGRGPASIAVHDHGQVPGHLLQLDT